MSTSGLVSVAVLGPLEVRRAGSRLPVPAGKTTEVLIRLALDAGTLVRTERLIEDLWAAQAVGVARNTLQSKVSQLRRALGDATLVAGGAAGYTLHVAPEQVDALEAGRLADVVSALRERGDAAGADATGASALALFRGDILPDAGDAEWADPHRTRLAEVRLRLVEDRFAARLDLGAGGEVIAELESLVATHPLREGLWQLLITALYRAGRQADALDAYRRVRARLADDLGVDPGPGLRGLEQRILRQDRELAAPVHRGNLPSLTASLIGRAADLSTVDSLLGGHRLVTLVGPAGVGKTRLAVEAARHRTAVLAGAGGSWLVRLESTPPGAAPWPALGEAFGLSAVTESVVLDRLRGIDTLVVLDNCEHLVDDLPPLIGRLLDAVPTVRILATSQRLLGIDGEAAYPLEPLSPADSAALFRDRAVRHRRSFEASDDVVAALCRSLDGLPLAIELAAARVKALPAAEIARRLADRFTVLADPTSTRPARRRTLRAAIGWSYDLLFPDDQRGLWAVSCFADGAPLPAVEDLLAALGVPAAAAVDVVGRLVDRSLLAVEERADGTVRYRMLDSVREFSYERLTAAGLGLTAHAAQAGWFAAAAHDAAAGVHGPEQSRHLAFARTERANIDAVLAWTRVHDPELGLRIANGFGWAWVKLGAGADAARRARTACAAAGPSAPVADRVDGLLFTGWFEAAGGNLAQAVADVGAAIALADEDPALRAHAHVFLSFVHTQGGRPDAALDALADHRDALTGWEAGAAWLLTAWSEIALGRLARGQAACVEASRLLDPIGDAWVRSHAEGILGGLAQAQHRFGDATRHLRRAADAAHALGFGAAEALHLGTLGRALHQAGDHDSAIATLRTAVDTAHTAGDLRAAALAGVRLGRVLWAVGHDDAARTAVAAARSWFRAAGGGDGALLADHLAAALDASAAALDEVLAAARAAGDVEIEVLTLDSLALLSARGGGDARDLLAAADGLLPAVRHLVTDADRADATAARALLAAQESAQ